MTNEFYMHRCIELAKQGIGWVSPNPMVGCVIVHQDNIIGEGFHAKYGEAHAEVNAINNVITHFGDATACEILKSATVYVNLEPCAHFGKTPPCADLLIKHQVKSVIIGNIDTFDSVNGKGITKLKNAGINVQTGILEKECYFLNRRFFTRLTHKRPYFILKWAQTKNGYFAQKNNSQKWITGTEAKQMNHQWRSEEDAVLVGKNTVLIDNPQLTNRLAGGKNPIRIIIDKDLSLEKNYNIFNDTSKTIVLNELKTDVEKNIQYIQMEDMNTYLPQKIAYQMYLLDIQSVIIEGGANILNQFINQNMWDEARIFTANTEWEDGIMAPKINGKRIETKIIGNDTLHVFTNF